jgi:integrase/recombinase XerD
MKRSLKSRWRGELKEFLKFRQTNFTSASTEIQVRAFDRFATEHPDLPLPEVIEAWRNRGPKRNPATICKRLRTIKQFCLYRRRFDPNGFVPEWIDPAPSIRSHFRAQILSKAQIKLLLKTNEKMAGPPLRRARMRALFLVLYCTGLRIGEALRLRLVDVDLRQNCFRVGPSKGRVRLVPFGCDLGLELKHWLNCRRRAGFRLTPQTPLFEREDGCGDSVDNAGRSLNTIFQHCGFRSKRRSGKGGLRVHDIRHIFTVHRLERWYRAGRDPGPLLPWLSAYLGHLNILGTQRYYQATAQTLAIASRRFRRSLGFNPAHP